MSTKDDTEYIMMANGERKDGISRVVGLNAYIANFWMNVAILLFRMDAGKCWIGLMILLAWLYGRFAICLILISYFMHTIWMFELPKPIHNEAGGSINVLLGRSWRVSERNPKLPSNNNVSIVRFQQKYFAALRNANYHWPSHQASLMVFSANHPVGPWKLEWQHKTGEDLREMLFYELNGTLFLFYCSISNDILGTFNVEGTRCFMSDDGKNWYTPPGRACSHVSRPGELIWDVKVVHDATKGSIVYKTSYLGGHYQTTGDKISVLFEQSTNGLDWTPCGSSKDSIVYTGGICEVAFEFTSSGDLVAIGRNEDGDSTGFGSQLFFARASDLGTWQSLRISLPWRFDSPRMVRVEASGDILLFARYAYSRYDVVPKWMPRTVQLVANMFMYSVRPKTAAIFQVTDPSNWAGSGGPWTTCTPLKLVRFFEHGYANSDTGFFSLVPHPNISDSWFVANYSAMSHSHAWWVYGQLTPSDVYIAEVRVELCTEAESEISE